MDTNLEALRRLAGLSQMVGPGAAIEMEEARGAELFRASDTIPTRSVPDVVFQAFGFELGEVIPDRDGNLFRKAKLPPGWRRQAGEGSYQSHLVSSQGWKVFEIFYKAGHYDRRASITLLPRFRVAEPFVDGNFLPVMKIRDRALPEGQQILHRVPFPARDREAREAAWQQAVIWANVNLFSGWDDAQTAWLEALLRP